MKKIIYVLLGVIITLGILIAISPPKKMVTGCGMIPCKNITKCKGIYIETYNEQAVDGGAGGVCFGYIKETENDFFEEPRKTVSLVDKDNDSNQADWFVSSDAGWHMDTLSWETYSTVFDTRSVKFNYPPNYTVSVERLERRPGTFADYVIINDPNSRSGTDDRIFLGMPYTGANPPEISYMTKYDINGTGLDMAISKRASNFAKYIFENITASVTAN